jgi:hypothetical protein
MLRLKCHSIPTRLTLAKMKLGKPVKNVKMAHQAHPRKESVAHAIVMVAIAENATTATTTLPLKI